MAAGQGLVVLLAEEEWGRRRPQITMEELVQCGNRACCCPGCRGDQDRDTFTERVGLGCWEGEDEVGGSGEIGEELDRSSGHMRAGVEGGDLVDSEFTTPEEA